MNYSNARASHPYWAIGVPSCAPMPGVNVCTPLFGFVSEHWLSDSQLGGRPGIGVDFASHAVKSFIDYLFMKKLAGLLFFVDIHSAFYSYVRPMLYECNGDEDALALLVLRI